MISLRNTFDNDRGNVALSTVIVVPVLLLVGLLLLYAGRLALAQGAVQSAADEAARSASIARTVPHANEAAQETAASALTSHLTCSEMTVDTDARALGTSLGNGGTVSTRVRCVVPVADLALPGLPGSVTIEATGRSPVDEYRQR